MTSRATRHCLNSNPLSSPSKLLLAFILGFFCAELVFLARLQPVAQLMSQPPAVGDDQDYDNLALNLARGRGFGHYWDDPEWRAPYEAANGDGRYAAILGRVGSYEPSAYRPPGFPFFLSLVYRFFGRDFEIGRYVNVTLSAIAVALAIVLGMAIGGKNLAIFTGVLGVFDPLVMHFSIRFLSEMCALTLMTAGALCLYGLPRRQSRDLSTPLAIGVICGLLGLTKAQLLVFSPLCASYACVALYKIWGRKQAFIASAIILLATSAVYLPWLLRNQGQVQSYSSSASQGVVNLVDAFSDETIQSRGLWTGIALQRAMTRFVATSADPTKSSTVSLNDYLLDIVKHWIGGNLNQLFLLTYYKLASLLWMDPPPYQSFLLVAGLVGLCLIREGSIRWALVMPVLSIVIAVAIFFNVNEGRFLLPAHGALWCLAGYSFHVVLARLVAFSQRMGPKCFGD